MTLSYIFKVRQGLRNSFQKRKTVTSTGRNNTRTSTTRSLFLSTTNASMLKNKVKNEFIIYLCWRRIFSKLNFVNYVYQIIFSGIQENAMSENTKKSNWMLAVKEEVTQCLEWPHPPPPQKSTNKTYRTINSYECGIVKFHQKPRQRQWILTLEWNFNIPHEYVIKGYFLYIILHKCDFWLFFFMTFKS